MGLEGGRRVIAPDLVVWAHGLRYVIRKVVTGGYRIARNWGRDYWHSWWVPTLVSWRLIRRGVYIASFNKRAQARSYARRHALKIWREQWRTL